jgi:hypothetical protein
MKCRDADHGSNDTQDDDGKYQPEKDEDGIGEFIAVTFNPGQRT